MAFRSGSTRYLVRESPDEIVDGIRDILTDEGLAVLETRTRRGVRLRLDDSRAGPRVPPFEIGELELRFRPRGEELEVEVRSRRRRRYWTLAVMAGLGVASIVVDIFAGMGFVTLELNRGARQARKRREREEPRMLDAAATYLGPRALGPGDATPFRR